MDAAAPDSVSLGGALVAWQCAACRGPAAQQVVAKGGYRDYLADEPLHRRNARIRLRAIERFDLRAGRVLDVGCASGFFLSEARQQGWEVVGLDVSPPWAARETRARLDIPVHMDFGE